VLPRSYSTEPEHESGWQLVPEFRISQDIARAQVLDLARQEIGCGSLRENHKGSNDHTYVLVVRRRKDLLERVIPFFERNPLLSCKQDEFATFARIVRAMDRGEHLVNAGFERLAAEALKMNGGGRYRRLHHFSDSRILRDHMPSTLTET
jgi:LAGLIDADG endonuclease